MTEKIDTSEKDLEQVQAENNLDLAIPDLEQEQTTQNAAAPPIADAVEAFYGLLSLLPIGLTIAGLKHTAQAWSDDNCRAIARAAIPVLQKYTFGQKFIAFLETGGGVEEIALGVVLAPVAIATYQGYLLDTKPLARGVE